MARRSEIEALLASGVQGTGQSVGQAPPWKTRLASTYPGGVAPKPAQRRMPVGDTPSSWSHIDKQRSQAKNLRMPTTKEKWDKKNKGKSKTHLFPGYNSWQVRGAEMENAYDAMAKGKFEYAGTGSYAGSSNDRYEKTKKSLEANYPHQLSDKKPTPAEDHERRLAADKKWKKIKAPYGT